MNNPNRPFGEPTTPDGIIARAHRAAPFVWRKRVGWDRRCAAQHAVCGALNMQRHRLERLILSKRRQPIYTVQQRELLREAGKGYRNMRWLLLCFNPADDDNLKRVKHWTVAALNTIDAMVECERDVGGSQTAFSAHAAEKASPPIAAARAR